jgi:hypothetical protein
MTVLATYLKDPNATKDYPLDWSDWLPEGDTITSSSWIVEEGITEVVGKTSHDDTTATIWLSGGTVGESYLVTNRITTAQDRVDDRTIRIFVTQR